MHSDNCRLTFAITCGDRSVLRARLLESLSRAQLPFAFEVQMEFCIADQIGQARNALYARARGQWIYFLDEDCEWPEDHALISQLARLKADRAYTGPYRDGKKTALFGRAYNLMTNLWLKAHAAQGEPVPLAGNLMLPKLANLSQPYPEDAAFGGEEALLAARLKTLGILIEYEPSFAVLHNAQHTSIQFCQRAWRHGRSPKHGAAKKLSVSRVWRFQEAWHNPLLTFLVAGYHLLQRVSRQLHSHPGSRP